MKEMVKILDICLNLKVKFNFIRFIKNQELGFSYNHISNASLGDKNPGANSYMFNFLKTSK
jgi:hypothetical protein